jgi:hypothetical protein
MEIFGTNLSLIMGSWRIRFVFAIEDTDTPLTPKARIPHKMRLIPEDEYAR